MCTVTGHAIERAKQRWNVEKARDIQSIVRSSYERSVSIGEFSYRGTPTSIMLDKKSHRLLVVDSKNDTVVTVWQVERPKIAPVLVPDVLSVHKRRIGVYTRKIRAIQKRYDKVHEDMRRERDEFDRRIRELTLARDQLDGMMDNITYDLNKLNDEKKSVIQSMAQYVIAGE